MTRAPLLLLLLLACHDERRRFQEPPSGNVEDSAQAVNDGQRLYHWMNCAGCHGAGGGNMGPALMDARWIYGATPGAIHDSIAGGRPNGMPAFGGLLPDGEIWKIVAYVLTLSGNGNHAVAAARSDHMKALPPLPTYDQRTPRP